MATKLKSERRDEGGRLTERGTEVDRETPDGKYIVTLTTLGLTIKEKGRRLVVGPFDYGALYTQGVQRQAGLEPLRPHSRGRKIASRGLLATGKGR